MEREKKGNLRFGRASELRLLRCAQADEPSLYLRAAFSQGAANVGRREQDCEDLTSLDCPLWRRPLPAPKRLQKGLEKGPPTRTGRSLSVTVIDRDDECAARHVERIYITQRNSVQKLWSCGNGSHRVAWVPGIDPDSFE